MSDALDRGITVTEIASTERLVDVTPNTTAAFVGRALRGPLDTPVLLTNFAGFRRRFGGVWRHSSLGPAVRQFFEHGGRRLYVVRVANNARGAMICLPADHGVLVLRALEPGSTENIRAAVDYDGIDPVDSEHFNLTIQRVAPDSGLVADQEIFRRLSCRPDDRRYIGDALPGSSLIRVQCPLPPGRPLSTAEPGGDANADYVGHAQRGTDGGELSDYDLIGSAERHTGMFALDAIDDLDLLYMPPPRKEADLGPAAVLAAELYCRSRGAMLVLDPPANWTSMRAAIEGLRDSGYASSNIVSYFPRMISRDAPNAGPRAVGGAMAGLLCKLDGQHGPWQDLDQPGLRLSRGLAPALRLTAAEAAQLVREGLNVVAGDQAGRATFCGSVTLGRRSPVDRHFASLNVRRLCLLITSRIERATRWALFEEDAETVVARLRGQVHAYLCALADLGAFADGAFGVTCSADFPGPESGRERSVTILLFFRPAESDDGVSLTLHQTTRGCRVTPTAFAPVAAECA